MFYLFGYQRRRKAAAAEAEREARNRIKSKEAATKYFKATDEVRPAFSLTDAPFGLPWALPLVLFAIAPPPRSHTCGSYVPFIALSPGLRRKAMDTAPVPARR